MGGEGSSRWIGIVTKETCENCWVLDVTQMRRGLEHLAHSEHQELCSYAWQDSDTGEPAGEINYGLEQIDDAPYFRLQYAIEDKSIDMFLGIERSYPSFGGERWWFNCPPNCGRRCAKLYLPPGQLEFRCRCCYNLTYRSCNQSRQFDGLVRRKANETAEDWRLIKECY